MTKLLLLLSLFQIGCATLARKPMNSHYYCVSHFYELGAAIDKANDACKSIFRGRD